MGEHGVGIGGLANAKENYTTSRYNHYAAYTFEEEVVETIELEYYPQPVQRFYNGDVPIVIDIPPESERYTLFKTLKLHGNLNVRNKNSTTKWTVLCNTNKACSFFACFPLFITLLLLSCAFWGHYHRLDL